MGGVGGVSTLPPLPEKGRHPRLHAKRFSEHVSGGLCLSFLYPFSTAYYRQFGFENGAACQTWTLPIPP